MLIIPLVNEFGALCYHVALGVVDGNQAENEYSNGNLFDVSDQGLSLLAFSFGHLDSSSDS